eukprot:TRINITY_DN5631_c0_g1_i1.p1 TRINITY_DN5631_c0_g1~~TRINITY_DN5631_c0_g1_i1.p1  ORF type:complete len:208 (+),score=83.94 TRINITY_DN5631_c0_g1_i1:69-626(+)
MSKSAPSDDSSMDEHLRTRQMEHRTAAKASLARAEQLVAKSEALGADTLATLKKQDEQFGAMQDDVDEIAADLKQSKGFLKSISSFWGGLFSGGSEPKRPTRSLQPQRQRRADPAPPPAAATADAVDSEEEGLDRIRAGVHRIRLQATEIGETVSRQNDALDRIAEGVEGNQELTAKLNRKMRGM